MKILIHILVLVLLLNKSTCYAQNLVINPSFEDTISCPDAIGQLNKCLFWDNPTNGSPDFFHTCGVDGIDNSDVPNNFWGEQIPLNGSSYVGFGVEEDFNNKEYLSGKLSFPLDTLKNYLVSFYVSATGNLALDRLGIYFSSNQINQSTIGNLNFVPQIESPQYYTYGDTLSWVKIEGIFNAQGGEEFLVIGNFHDVSQNQYDTIKYNPLGGYISYYYVDDVSVTEIIDTTDSVPPIDSNLIEINLFPNPNNGAFTLNYQLGNREECFFKLYDAIGKLVYNEKLIQQNGIRNLEIPMAGGLYIWQVESENVVLKREKMIIGR